LIGIKHLPIIGFMGKSREIPQLTVGMNGKRRFGSGRPMEKARKPNNLL
jgi:hypothetical protein